MRRLLVLCCFAAVLVFSGCDPFGTDDTKIFLRGTVYTDSTQTEPAGDIDMFMLGDSVTTYDQSAVTDDNGEFFIEVPLHPTIGEEGTGYSLPDFGKIELEAHYGALVYSYGEHTILRGDTLTFWDIDLTMMSGAK
jgi:hypothetical protein